MSIWLTILAVGGLEMHIHNDHKGMFYLAVNFTSMPGQFRQATLWRWNEGLQEYSSNAMDEVAHRAECWGKELLL